MKTKNIIKIFIVLLLGLASFTSNAQTEKYKGALIYQFTRYVEWSNLGSEFTICVIGETPVYDVLKALEGAKQAKGKEIKVVKVNSVSEAEGKQILFIPDSKKDQLASAKGKSGLLVITESSGLAKAGAAINFVQRDGKVKFEMNKSAFTSSGLKVDLNLERMAVAVY